jgi:hypothetical protein
MLHATYCVFHYPLFGKTTQQHGLWHHHCGSITIAVICSTILLDVYLDLISQTDLWFETFVLSERIHPLPPLILRPLFAQSRLLTSTDSSNFETFDFSNSDFLISRPLFSQTDFTSTPSFLISRPLFSQTDFTSTPSLLISRPLFSQTDCTSTSSLRDLCSPSIGMVFMISLDCILNFTHDLLSLSFSSLY